MNPSLIRVLGLIAALALPGAVACAIGGRAVQAPKAENVAECIFVKQDHQAAACLHGLETVLADSPDGLLFIERNSVIRVRVPAGHESYHIHLWHKIDEHSIDAVVIPAKGDDGIIEIPLADYPRPELLVVTSAEHRTKPTAAASAEQRALGSAVLPPFALALKLVAKDEAATLISLQNSRYELRTPLGTLQLLVTPANRGDMLLTLVDLEGQARRIFRDAYFHYRPADAALTPRMTVEVLGTDRAPWQRVGVWPLPPDVHSATAGTKGTDSFVFALRTNRRDLLPFAPPPELTITYPKDAPRTRLDLGARITGAAEKSTFQLVVSDTVPADRDAKTYAFHTQTVDLSQDRPEASVAVTLDSPAFRFPLTASVAHRLVTKWITKAGFYDPAPALGVSVVDSLDPVDVAAPAHVISPSCAAYYDLVNFTGDGGFGAHAALRALGLASGSGGGGTDGGAMPSPNTFPNPFPGTTSWWTTWGGIPVPVGGDGTGSNSNASSSGASGVGGGGPSSPWTWTPGLVPPPPPPPPPNGQLDIKLKCGCKPPPKENCKCFMHSWNQPDLMSKIRQYKYMVGSDGRKYEIADYSFFSSHGNLIPCHTPTVVGTVRISFWVGLSLHHQAYDVRLAFGPCPKGFGLPPKKVEKKEEPGMPKPGAGGDKPAKPKGDPKPKPDPNAGEPVPSVDKTPHYKPEPPPEVTEDDVKGLDAPLIDPEKWKPATDGQIADTPYNSPTFAIALAGHRHRGGALATGSVAFAVVGALEDRSAVDNDFARAYRAQAERNNLGTFDSWHYDPAKFWPVYDASRPIGGGGRP